MADVGIQMKFAFVMMYHLIDYDSFSVDYRQVVAVRIHCKISYLSLDVGMVIVIHYNWNSHNIPYYY
jgi:hypothetical protein